MNAENCGRNWTSGTQEGSGGLFHQISGRQQSKVSALPAHKTQLLVDMNEGTELQRTERRKGYRQQGASVPQKIHAGAASRRAWSSAKARSQDATEYPRETLQEAVSTSVEEKKMQHQ